MAEKLPMAKATLRRPRAVPLEALKFVVYGIPQPKGSTKAFIPKGWTRPIVTSDNAKNKGWQQLVAEAAHAAIAALPDGFCILDGAARLDVHFQLPRPKSIRDKHVLHTKRPDLDKLVRSVKDALSKIVWTDDAIVCVLRAVKSYAEPGAVPCAVITICEISLPLFAEEGTPE